MCEVLKARSALTPDAANKMTVAARNRDAGLGSKRFVSMTRDVNA
jgi:hypothetical protein